MKGFGMFLAVLAIAVVVGGFVTGVFTTDGVPSGVPTAQPPAVGHATETAKGFTLGHWPLLLVAGGGAFLAIRFWNKIGGYGRGFLLVLGTAAVVAWLVTR